MELWQEEAFTAFKGGSSETLVVLVHGMWGSSDQLRSVAKAALKALHKADVYAPTLPYGGPLGLFNSTPPVRIVCHLLAAVDGLNDARRKRCGKPYRRIFIIGYSIGALVARKLAVIARGELGSARFEPGYEGYKTARSWSKRVERIVLLGGVSRGWSPRSASSFLISSLFRVYALIATPLPARRGLVMESRFGLPFSVQTRLEWLALAHEDHKGTPPLVQLLGSLDNVVSPNDMIDTAIDGISKGQHVLLDVAATTHLGTVKMGAEPGALARRELLADALTWEMKKLAKHRAAISQSLLSDGKAAQAEEDVKDVVFVIHGIRDKGFWTSKVARAIKREAAQLHKVDDGDAHVRSMTESYGYLPMLPFLWVGVRRTRTAWLMDRYVEARARYPKAVIHFVGHSNGTYLAARALQDYPAARFGRIVFAGSVVRVDFDWESRFGPTEPQVRGLLNYVASNDWIVGLFPAALRWVDLGGAGHSGFRDIAPITPASDVARVQTRQFGEHHCYQIRYVRGGHGAGMAESQWDEIAKFIIRGQPPNPVNSDYVGRQTIVARALGAAPPLGLLFAIASYIAIAIWLGYDQPWLLALLGCLTLIALLRF